jgi:hypothetical protein
MIGVLLMLTLAGVFRSRRDLLLVNFLLRSRDKLF